YGVAEPPRYLPQTSYGLGETVRYRRSAGRQDKRMPRPYGVDGTEVGHCGLMHLTATELHRRGLEATNARRFAAARRALSQAAERTDDPDLRARISGTMAYVLAQTGQPADAERLCRETLAGVGLHPDTTAILNGQLGV